MDYLSVKETADKFELSERRVQKLCEMNRIEGAKRVSGVWIIPSDAVKPSDERLTLQSESEDTISLSDLCTILSISLATGKNWVKLGKIVPDYVEKKTCFFDKENVEKIVEGIKSGENKALKSRRNKKHISGNALYNSYVSEKCRNLSELQKLFGIIESEQIELTEDIIRVFVADCAVKLLSERMNVAAKEDKLLRKYINKEISFDEYNQLIDDILPMNFDISEFISNNPMAFKMDYVYEKQEDILGLIYISCKNIANRKATGSYYTPTKVVRGLIEKLDIVDGRVLDPCCGTGNFLLQLPNTIAVDNIYGNDIDSMSVNIARINMALKYSGVDINVLYKNITEKDYLNDYSNGEFDYIIGNPPWGFEYDESESSILRKKYRSAVGKNIESYDVFIEEALKQLKKGGYLSYVLPEAVLNVKSHMPIRNLILEGSSIKYLNFIGNAFDGVQCPCIILQILNTEETLSCIGMKVNDGKREFTINEERHVDAEYFSFITNDEEHRIIEKVNGRQDVRFLKDNAIFALGIVTGNNKDYISTTKNDENEMVLKGADICKYHFNDVDNYIIFKPESFQQIAPTEYYRAPEKLLYRFISSQLVFAYDDKQTLSLNSCNLVIPSIDGLSIKYIMAILNSRVAQFIFKKQFNSIKVLRSHIESIPIPYVGEEVQQEIIKYADELIAGCNEDRAVELYDIVDDIIFNIFEISENEKQIIKDAVDGDNKFLV